MYWTFTCTKQIGFFQVKLRRVSFGSEFFWLFEDRDQKVCIHLGLQFVIKDTEDKILNIHVKSMVLSQICQRHVSAALIKPQIIKQIIHAQLNLI